MNRIILISVFSILTLNVMEQEKIVQTAGRDQLGEFAPNFAELNDDILFGQVWSRTDKLSLRDRSLVTVTSLISQGITDNSLASPPVGEEERHHPHRYCRNHHPYRFLCWLAQSMGGVQSGKRRMGGRYYRRKRQSRFPAGDDFPDRRA